MVRLRRLTPLKEIEEEEKEEEEVEPPKQLPPLPPPPQEIDDPFYRFTVDEKLNAIYELLSQLN